MSSCLGLYIQDNLIKYAKVTKDKDLLKVEAFGVKFYDQVMEAISQIVSETFSYKTPININLSDESYNYFYLFSLLNKNDIKKSIETEFDSLCYDKGYNKNTLETRYALVPDMADKEKIKVIHISNNKIDINRKLQDMGENSISGISPLPMVIPNIVQVKEKENAIIVNIENKTTITTILDQQIYNVDILEDGANTFLDSISQKENSYSKAYEICKNTTIYTMEGKDLQADENLYLQDIMPTLYNIVEGVRKIIDESTEKITKIYITGTGAVINNIDLYFQEYFTDCKCEIIKPYFIPETVKINIKDYIEVNSAIALGMQGLGYGVKNINFKNPTLMDRLPSWMKMQGKNKKAGDEQPKSSDKKKFNFNRRVNFSLDLKGALDTTERWLIRTATSILAFVLIYTGISTFLVGSTKNKMEKAEEVKQHTDTQISLVENDTTSLNNKITEYNDMFETIQTLKKQTKENKNLKNSIPNFLTSLMFAVPKGVSIKSITNTQSYTIRVVAESKLYSQLGYLIGSMKTGNMLDDITSSASVKKNDIITVVIEGTLPESKLVQ